MTDIELIEAGRRLRQHAARSPVPSPRQRVRSRSIALVGAALLAMVAVGLTWADSTTDEVATGNEPEPSRTDLQPEPADFPAWGFESGCPSLANATRPAPITNEAVDEALAALAALGRTHADDRALTDPALWPLVDRIWESSEGSLGTGTLTRQDAAIAPAQASAFADLIATNCGASTVEASLWVAVCPVESRNPCDVSRSPSLTGDFVLLRRADYWYLWFVG